MAEPPRPRPLVPTHGSSRDGVDSFRRHDLHTSPVLRPDPLARLYWTESPLIIGQNLHLSDPGKTQLELPILNVAGKAYWTQEGASVGCLAGRPRRIESRATSRGLRCVRPRRNCVGSSGGKVYWADTNCGQTQRGNMDDTRDPKTFLESDSGFNPRGFTMACISAPPPVPWLHWEAWPYCRQSEFAPLDPLPPNSRE
jgi:hypothetical protein